MSLNTCPPPAEGGEVAVALAVSIGGDHRHTSIRIATIAIIAAIATIGTNVDAENAENATLCTENAHKNRVQPSSCTDFPCLRQLPPPPKRAPPQKGSDVEKDDKQKRKNKENAIETEK